jgi:VanZ family protein
MSVAASLKPLRYPRFWLALWWLAVIVTVVVCLVPAADLPETPPGGDKVQHFLAYFVLMASAVQLYAGQRSLLRVALGLLVMGIAIEFAQAALTTTRAADLWDAVADLLGILAGWGVAWTPLRDLLLHLERKVVPRA